MNTPVLQFSCMEVVTVAGERASGAWEGQAACIVKTQTRRKGRDRVRGQRARQGLTSGEHWLCARLTSLNPREVGSIL